jgi:hypothetical protein
MMDIPRNVEKWEAFLREHFESNNPAITMDDQIEGLKHIRSMTDVEVGWTAAQKERAKFMEVTTRFKLKTDK